jgi:hypothetical protein
MAGGALRVQDTESESLFVTEQTGHGAERGRLRTRARRITHHSKSADPGEELHKLYWILALGPSSGVWLLETELRMRSYPSAKLDVDIFIRCDCHAVVVCRKERTYVSILSRYDLRTTCFWSRT